MERRYSFCRNPASRRPFFFTERRIFFTVIRQALAAAHFLPGGGGPMLPTEPEAAPRERDRVGRIPQGVSTLRRFVPAGISAFPPFDGMLPGRHGPPGRWPEALAAWRSPVVGFLPAGHFPHGAAHASPLPFAALPALATIVIPPFAIFVLLLKINFEVLRLFC